MVYCFLFLHFASRNYKFSVSWTINCRKVLERLKRILNFVDRSWLCFHYFCFCQTIWFWRCFCRGRFVFWLGNHNSSWTRKDMWQVWCFCHSFLRNLFLHSSSFYRFWGRGIEPFGHSSIATPPFMLDTYEILPVFVWACEGETSRVPFS